jgi:uncharacterized protein (TIGR00369 family)
MTEDELLALIDPTGVPYWVMLGIRVEQADRGRVTLRLPMQPSLGTRRAEVMHGGAIASLVDAAAGAVTSTLKEPDDESWAGQATTDMNVTFLNAATGDVLAEGRVLRSSRSLAFVGVEVRTEDGTHVASGRATYTIIRRR